MNSNRQRRILANAVRLLKPGGYLAYMTCTYAIKENERVVEWLLKKNDHLAAVEVDAVADFRSSYSEVPCYRMWPFQNVGAGGFAALFRSEAEATDDGASRFSVRSLPVVWSFDEQKNW
jgi:16S rRNA C967 or C1407 C5-methylase (RsmB/RsmF family)